MSQPSPSAAAAHAADGGFATLSRLSLREEAARAIRAQIVTGRLSPGTLYAIGPIAEALGVSVTPVREALLDLSKDELVEVVRNRGFRVTTLDDADLDEIFEIRIMLEVPAIRKLAGMSLTAEIAALRSHVTRIGECAAAGDLLGFLAHDRDLHRELLALQGNRRLVEAISRLRDQSRLYGLQGLVGSPRLLETAREHGRLLDAIEAGEDELAARLMTQHLRHTRGLWAGHEEKPAGA